MTRNAVVASREHRFKARLRSDHLLARVGLVDPALKDNLPRDPTASTGLDALTQLIEPCVSNRAEPITDALALRDVALALRALPRAVQAGSDASARDDMALASLMGGLCLANAGLGAVHGFAAPLGASFPVPHGAACAALRACATAAPSLRVYYDRTVSGTIPPPPASNRLSSPGVTGHDPRALEGERQGDHQEGITGSSPALPAPPPIGSMRAHQTGAIPFVEPASTRRTATGPIAMVSLAAAPPPTPYWPVVAEINPVVPPPPVSTRGVAGWGWPQVPESSFRVASTRGEYLVGRQVGAGYFGAVFECLGPFDQRYAIKVLRPTDRPMAKVREEWAREVRRLLALRHPNVVYIHDAFEWQGTFCVALEWCDHTLRDMLEQPLREELAIELSRQMLAAVQYLHDSDLVHDDLHPGNVLIQQADRPIVKISDFGISTELRGAPAARPELVHHAIMAPELLAAGYTSKQSDLYQIGLIMYWMITGRPPIDLEVPYPLLAAQIADGVARQRAEALGTPFGAVVAKLLRRRDVYRYTSAREVWADLRQLPAWQTRALFPVR